VVETGNAIDRASSPSSVDSFHARATTILVLLLALLAAVGWYEFGHGNRFSWSGWKMERQP
jgi:hypothetical protein